MPELTGTLETALYVSDVGRSVAFYVEVLGFEVIAADERITALAVGSGQVLLICARGASAGLGATAHDGRGQQHVAFAIPRAELAPWRHRLEESGIAIVAERDWPRGGRSLYFRDSDGHLLELATPGVWSVY